jgi:hypothetical protein
VATGLGHFWKLAGEVERSALPPRLLPDIRFGTERYPEKVARRLRTVNIGTRIAAACYAPFFCRRVVRLFHAVLVAGSRTHARDAAFLQAFRCSIAFI